MSNSESTRSEESTPATSTASLASNIAGISLKGSGFEDNHNAAELEKLVQYILREAQEKALELHIKVSSISLQRTCISVANSARAL